MLMVPMPAVEREDLIISNGSRTHAGVMLRTKTSQNWAKILEWRHRVPEKVPE